MKIFKFKKCKIKSSINTFRKNTITKRKVSDNNILQLTKSIIMKKITNNNFVEEYINKNITKNKCNSTSKIDCVYNPITDSQIYTKKNNSIKSNTGANFMPKLKKINISCSSIINYGEETTNNKTCIDSSFILMNLKNSLTQNLKKRHTFFHKIKNIMNHKNNKNNEKKKLSESSKNIFKERKKYIYEKLKKRIKDYKNEEKIKLFSFNKIGNLNYEKLKYNYDTLFIEFFYKWYKDKITGDGIKTIINEKYSDLIYNENEIFHYDFSEYINDKMKEYSKEKIHNLQDKLQSNFYDKNNKEIKLVLNGMKLTFMPKNKNSKNIIMFLPFTFSLLFYYKGIKFFRCVLSSIINFDNDFSEISLNYDDIDLLINKIVFKKINEDNYEQKAFNTLDNETIGRRKKKSKTAKKVEDNTAKKAKTKKNDSGCMPIITKDDINHHKKDKLEYSYRDINLDNHKKKIKIHSNLSKKIKKEIFYNSYLFIWETPKISYKVILEMPKIIFKYQNISKNINIFCHQKMMLFLLKNHFVNWDFYIMNYLFSIKAFRNTILNFMSYKSTIDNMKNNSKTERNDNKIIITQKINKKQFNNIEENQKSSYLFFLFEKYNNIYLENNSIKHLFHQFNLKNEVYYFFYTNNSRINSIVFFNSYKIIVDYEKLNPYYFWEFIPNFKQMKFLNEIKCYETLSNFIPKILLTNHENGNLTLDFSVFDDFEPKIMNYEKREVINPHSSGKRIANINRKQKDEILLTINNPNIQIEQYSSENIKSRDVNSCNDNSIRELNDDYLKKIDDKDMESWSKIIIEYIENQHLMDNNNVNETPILQKNNTKKRRKIRFSTVVSSSNKIKSIFSLNN